MDKKQARLSILRERADKLLKQDPPLILYAGNDIDVLLQELHIHQVALEIQLDDMNRAYAALEIAQQRYSNLFDGTSIAYFTLNPHGLIINANLAAGRMLGQDAQVLKGKRFVTFIVSDFRNLYYSSNMLIRMEQESQSYDMELYHKTGTKLAVIVNIDVPDPESDEILLAITDLSILTNKDALIRNKELALEVGQLRLTTLAAIAPEFQKPLATILSCVDILYKHRRRLSEKRSNQIFDTIRNLIWYMNDAIQDTRNIQELDKKQLFDTESFDVFAFTQQIVDDMELISEGQAIKLQMISSQENVNIQWNINLYRRVLINLFGSLLKYSNETIYCQLELRNGSFSLSVETQAASLFRAELEQLFSEFHKEKSSKTTRTRGHDLMLVYDMVRSYGGTMHYSSNEAKGICFSITLPSVQSNPSPYTQ